MDIILKSKDKNFLHITYLNGDVRYSECLNEKLDNFKTLAEKTKNNFDACVDKYSNFHFIIQENKKRVVYIFKNNEKWYKKVILESQKDAEIFVSKFKIFCPDEIPFLIYPIIYEGSALLTYHEISNSLSPMVLDKIDEKIQKFTANIDKFGNIYLFYVKKDNNGKPCLGFRKYEHSTNMWSNFEKVRDGSLNFSTVIDKNENILHLCFIEKNKVYYSNTSLKLEKQVWKIDTCFTYGTKDPCEILIFITEEKLYICVQNGSFMTIVNSENFGETWKIFNRNLNFKARKIDLYKIEVLEEKSIINRNFFFGKLSNRSNNAFLLPTGEKLGSFSIEGNNVKQEQIKENYIKTVNRQLSTNKVYDKKNSTHPTRKNIFAQEEIINKESRKENNYYVNEVSDLVKKEEIKKIFQSFQDELCEKISEKFLYLDSLEDKICAFLNKLVKIDSKLKTNKKNANRRKRSRI